VLAVVIEHARADGIISPGDKSSDVVREWSLKGVMAERADAENGSSGSPP
jgi:hypothetical protein